MKRIYFIIGFLVATNIISAQTTPFILRGVLKENRQQLYRNIVKNSITKNLSLLLTDSTEENWQDAFWAMELINYKSAWVDSKIYEVFKNIQNYHPPFQRALLELAYTNYKDVFLDPVNLLLQKTNDSKIFAMCALYILPSVKTKEEKRVFINKISIKTPTDNPIIKELYYHLLHEDIKLPNKALYYLFDKSFLPGNVLLFSIQRKNRDFPGLAIVRDAAGNFIKDNNDFFSVPQLARSITNLPGYLTNGNTPEGIFRMDGFDTSKSIFIGPTTNIQLTMPYEEDTPNHFYKDSTQMDNWGLGDYEKLLPDSLKNYFPLYEVHYASEAGRTAIIAHGTTIDPLYYKNKPYYPLTPTQGCLCTKEIWSDETGMLMESDQLKLVNAIIKAGGPNGYAIVINIDDQQKPVELNDILEFLQTANQK
ncbi:MAG: hypothetical protein ABI402_09700 [Ferruginibacter sp.]